MKNPTKFQDLPVAELRRSAVEDFAVEVSDSDPKIAVIQALEESGVKWGDYVKQHPEVVAPAEPVVEEVVVAVEAPTEPVADKNVLVRMDRDNPLFEIRGAVFTSTHPYALMTPEDASFTVNTERGFSIATPQEVAEFYS